MLRETNPNMQYLLSHAHPFSRYAHFCIFDLLFNCERHKNHLISQIDSTSSQESKYVKIFEPRLLVKKIRLSIDLYYRHVIDLIHNF
jgi:hypothetical protein